ncbi:transglutaminase domain-containing protein [uncultured Acetobacteroides sp.]|uniref:transglutaminase domain-containing protein n=1 Tax=uncultured Acetobacteroides sp. TaxID=1760811 RepID=UPI0029F4CEB3|nr:transglutaminase domain-containing protein [uncultured Acetobacteroides sp.]
MRFTAAILAIVLVSLSGFAQSYRKVDRFVHSALAANTGNVDSLSAQIAGSFSRESDRLRAAYGWICSNIEYDVERMANPISYRGDSAVRVTLAKRKAICSGYADLFIGICRQLDIKAYYVSGYTKQDGGIVDQSHAWVAVRLSNGQWKLFDPTWGASTWQGGELVKRLSYEYFMREPADFIKTHMPFDPMWQLLYQPVMAAEFYGQKVVKDADYLFNYSDTISDYQILPEPRMYANAMRRMRWGGIRNESSARYYQFLEKEYAFALENERRTLHEIWLYAFCDQEKDYQTSVEMYEQLQQLKTDYSSRGVSFTQLQYQSDVLLEHSKKCVEALKRLKPSEQADLLLWDALCQKVESMQELVERQHKLIGSGSSANAKTRNSR